MGLIDTIRLTFAAPKRPQFFLGAFGKHPGWDDHLDDLGLETEALLAAKHFIYNQGIGGVIDSGQWDALGDEALPDFDHLIVWLSGDEMLAGRMWSSSDGKGRKRYPMILCAQLSSAGGLGRLKWVAGLLDEWGKHCREARSAADVRHVVQDGKAFVSMALAGSEEHPNPALSRRAFSEKVGLSADSEAAARVAYAAESYLAPFAPTSGEASRLALNLKLAESRLVPQHFRFRAIEGSPEASIQYWNDFLSPYLAPSAPRLFLAPRQNDWIDIIVGLPTSKHMVCLKERPKAMPLTCSIPFGLDEEFRAKAIATFRRFLDGSES